MRKLLKSAFYSLCVLAVAVALLISWLSGFTIEIPLTDRTMRPAIGARETKFDVDAGWLDEPRRDTIVAFLPPGEERPKYRAVRVVAVAGDRVEIRAHKPYVNGAVPGAIKGIVRVETLPESVVPRDCVYVLNHSSGMTDSVDFGPLPLWRVGGRLVVK